MSDIMAYTDDRVPVVSFNHHSRYPCWRFHWHNCHSL